MNKEDKTLTEIEAIVDKHKKVQKDATSTPAAPIAPAPAPAPVAPAPAVVPAPAAKAEEQPFTKADMEEIVKQMTEGKKPGPVVQQPSDDERKQIAYQIWKDQKSKSIVCLIAVILPMIAVLITVGFGEMYALIISFAVIIYPLIVFVKSMMTQARLQRKYGLKPLFQFQPQQPMQQQPMQQQPKDNREEVLL